MCAAAVLEERVAGPGSLIGLSVGAVRPEIFTDWAETCPACGHEFVGEHREVYPGAAQPPLLLCFVAVRGISCFTQFGACRRDRP